jgi:hypothetical protein
MIKIFFQDQSKYQSKIKVISGYPYLKKFFIPNLNTQTGNVKIGVAPKLSLFILFLCSGFPILLSRSSAQIYIPIMKSRFWKY